MTHVSSKQFPAPFLEEHRVVCSFFTAWTEGGAKDIYFRDSVNAGLPASAGARTSGHILSSGRTSRQG